MAKIFQLFSVAFLLTCTFVCSGNEGILTFSGTGGYVNGTAGWSFDPTVNISVTSLGASDVSTFGSSPLLVGLWDQSGSLLASTTVSSNDPIVNLTHYDSITPVTLTAGQTYYLGAYAVNGGTTVVVGEDPPGIGGFATTSSQIQLLTAVLSTNSGFSFPNTIAGDPGSALFGPNFQFTVVPEPSIAALAIVGGSALFSRSLIRRKNSARP